MYVLLWYSTSWKYICTIVVLYFLKIYMYYCGTVLPENIYVLLWYGTSWKYICTIVVLYILKINMHYCGTVHPENIYVLLWYGTSWKYICTIVVRYILILQTIVHKRLYIILTLYILKIYMYYCGTAHPENIYLLLWYDTSWKYVCTIVVVQYILKIYMYYCGTVI